MPSPRNKNTQSGESSYARLQREHFERTIMPGDMHASSPAELEANRARRSPGLLAAVGSRAARHRVVRATPGTRPGQPTGDVALDAWQGHNAAGMDDRAVIHPGFVPRPPRDHRGADGRTSGSYLPNGSIRVPQPPPPASRLHQPAWAGPTEPQRIVYDSALTAPTVPMPLYNVAPDDTVAIPRQAIRPSVDMRR